eukprot:Gb_07510 [translate_table: standard]
MLFLCSIPIWKAFRNFTFPLKYLREFTNFAHQSQEKVSWTVKLIPISFSCKFRHFRLQVFERNTAAALYFLNRIRI